MARSSHTPRQRRKEATVYRAAAKLLETEQERYSCIAIRNSANWSDSERLRARYIAAMTEGESEGAYQFAIYDASREVSGPLRDDEWCHNFRILALCFMAAMVEAGDA